MQVSACGILISTRAMATMWVAKIPLANSSPFARIGVRVHNGYPAWTFRSACRLAPRSVVTSGSVVTLNPDAP